MLDNALRMIGPQLIQDLCVNATQQSNEVVLLVPEWILEWNGCCVRTDFMKPNSILKSSQCNMYPEN
jgi:hypothetical protein